MAKPSLIAYGLGFFYYSREPLKRNAETRHGISFLKCPEKCVERFWIYFLAVG